MGGAVEVNVTFYSVETFTSVSVQRPVVMRAVEVEIGTIFHELSTQYIINGTIAYTLSNSGVY